MRRAAPADAAVNWSELTVAGELLALADGLVKEKYSQTLHNQKR